MSNIEHLKYPIGRYAQPETIDHDTVVAWIQAIEDFPEKLANLTSDLSNNQLDTRYRENGWTVRQVVHHCYDSHVNSYVRFKWALTEDVPLIKPYDEASWCELADSKLAPIEMSIAALKALHAKWVYLLKGLSENELNRTFIHPDYDQEYTLKEVISLYAWHCDHHFAHIYELRKRKGW